MALGALIGGLLLAGTEYRRQVEVTIEPFKGLLVGVFLISIGMSLDLRTLVAHPAIVLGAADRPGGAEVAAGRRPGARLRPDLAAAALQAGLLLGPGGEFGFVIVAVALAHRLLDGPTASLVLLVTALTMTASRSCRSSAPGLSPRAARAADRSGAAAARDPPNAAPRVIIAGFGRVGQTVAALLEAHRVPYVAIDRDADRVAHQRKRGRSGLLRRHDAHRTAAPPRPRRRPRPGRNAGRPRGRRRAGRGRPGRAGGPADRRPRARRRHAALLYRAGATDAVPETIEASLQLSEAVLVDVGIAMGPVMVSIHEKRAELQTDIKAMVPRTWTSARSAAAGCDASKAAR